MLPNHFEGKFGGESAATRRRLARQTARVAELYRALAAAEETLVAILGDLNDTPESEALAPYLRDTDLREVTSHSAFDPADFNAGPNSTRRGIGTYELGNDNDRIDDLMLSPALFARTQQAALFRKGAWPGSRAHVRAALASARRQPVRPLCLRLRVSLEPVGIDFGVNVW